MSKSERLDVLFDWSTSVSSFLATKGFSTSMSAFSAVTSTECSIIVSWACSRGSKPKIKSIKM